MARTQTPKQGKTKQASNRKGNSRKRSNKSDFRSKEVDKDFEGASKGASDMPHNTAARCADNDPSWYTHVYPLAQDVASFNYNIPVGTPFNPLKVGDIKVGPDTIITAEQNSVLGKVVPGIFTLQVMPSIGYSADPTSAPNIAAQQLYSLVRKANSGSVNYDKTDLMMMVIAMDSAYMLYEDLLRAYRLIGRYDVDSRYMPDALMFALGFAPELQKDLANFRALLDTFAYKFGAINVPDQFDFIKRHSWLFSNVYTDSESSKAQLYAYVPDGYYKWVEGKNGEPTHLEYVKRGNLFQTEQVSQVSEMYRAMNTLMEPLLGSQDIGVMSGDIAKAFGEGGMISVIPAGQYETLTPTYSMEVIQQMMNSTILSTDVGNANIRANNDNLESGPYLDFEPVIVKSRYNTAKALHKHLVNIRQSGGVEINMVATRNMCVVDWKADTTGTVVSCGTEIVTHAYMHVLASDGYHITSMLPSKYEFVQEPIFPMSGIEAATKMDSNEFSRMQDDIRAMLYASAFDNHPTMYMFFRNKWVSGQKNTLTFQGVYQDYDNYAWLDDQTVKQLNDAALISLFYTQSWPNI